MQAFVLRVSPSGIDRVPEALEHDVLMVGWADATGLLDESLGWEEFRGIVSRSHYAGEDSMRRAGAAAGHLWRFIRDMQVDDLVVVPYYSNFYVARVTGPAHYLDEKRVEDSSYRRPVEWLNGKRPIPRGTARSALISRMKIHGTSATATDLIAEIHECLDVAQRGKTPDFNQDLQAGLVRRALEELRNGRIDDYGFENLIRQVLLRRGASEARVVPRSQGKGADVVATFRIADTFQFVVAVQAKHWQPEPPVGTSEVHQLIAGMDAEEADLGMFITTGTYSPEAEEAARAYEDVFGKRIELVDGEQFAKMLIERGVSD